MTPQEIFDTVARHLVLQGKPAIGHDGDCMYRDPHTGAKCAVGCLISDDVYTEAMEHKSAKDMLIAFPVLQEKFASNIDLLMDLQAVHDGSTPVAVHEIFGWQVDRRGEAIELMKSLHTPGDDTAFNIPALYRALTFVAYKHNLNPEVLS